MKQRAKHDQSINTFITIGAIAATIGGWIGLSRDAHQSTLLEPQTEQQVVSMIEPAPTLGPIPTNQPLTIQQRPATTVPRAITRTRSSR